MLQKYNESSMYETNILYILSQTMVDKVQQNEHETMRKNVEKIQTPTGFEPASPRLSLFS